MRVIGASVRAFVNVCVCTVFPKKNLIFSYLEIDEVIFIFLLINQGSRVLMEQISYV